MAYKVSYYGVSVWGKSHNSQSFLSSRFSVHSLCSAGFNPSQFNLEIPTWVIVTTNVYVINKNDDSIFLPTTKW